VLLLYFQLDAKNSPLALLAQTCSSIGKDPPSKPIIPPIEKKESPQKPGSADKDSKSSPTRDIDGRVSRDSQKSNSNNTSKDITNFYPISTSSPKPDKCREENPRSSDGRISVDNERKSHQKPSRPLSNSSSSGLSGTKSGDRPSPPPKQSDKLRDIRDSKCSPPPKHHRSESPVRRDSPHGYESKHSHPMYPGLPYGHMGYPSLQYGPGGLQHSAEALAAAGYPYGIPGASSYSLASAHALAAHQAALKSSSLSQYMQYASRMRAPSGVSACKDPYCTNCLSSGVPTSSHLSQCTTPGCAQCSHEKALQGLFGIPGSNPIHSTFGVPSSASLGLSHLHSLYAQNLLSQQGQQHVCNWMVGNEYCGKRFNSSEELLQHLRTHTAGGESALSAYGSLGLSIPTPGDLPGLPGYLGTGSSISPETLRRMYPTSLSPLGGSSLSSRYHPYKSSVPGGPPSLPGAPSISSLGPYYSPYSVYGSRIGSAAVP